MRIITKKEEQEIESIKKQNELWKIINFLIQLKYLIS